MKLVARIQKQDLLYTRVSLEAIRSNHQVSSESARRDLGHAPHRFEATIADTLEWFVHSGYLRLPAARPEPAP